MPADLTQDQANTLLAMKKVKAELRKYDFPSLGGKLNIPLESSDGREKFTLDISRRKIELRRNKFQTRARETVILARLDLDDTPHRNPDGKDVPGPHLHLYKEEYGDKWAYPLPEDFTNPDDCMETLRNFMSYCAITDAPNIFGGLFT